MIKLYKNFFILLLFFISHPLCFADNIIILPKTIIAKNTTYQNTTLDLNNGSFIITNNATLKIENCIINGKISPDNSFLINLVNGKLVLKSSTLNLVASFIEKKPNVPALNYAINIQSGAVDIADNRFTMDKSYTVGLLTTRLSPTENFMIKNNFIYNFHGGFLLRRSNNASILNNKFLNVSGGNIFIIEGSNNLVHKNTILFAGNNNVGDGVDILNSDHITLTQNYISSDSCYSMVIASSKNILIDHNKITGGITYAVYIVPSMSLLDYYYENYLSELIGEAVFKYDVNTNIIVTHNYFSQNGVPPV